MSWGSARQKTRLLVFNSSSCFAFGSSKNWPPTKTRPSPSAPSFSSKMLTSFAIAAAVGAESPVIITTRMPASRQRRIEAATSGRAGSLMPTSPVKVRPRSTSTNLLGLLIAAGHLPSAATPSHFARAPRPRSLVARARQRSGRRAISVNVSRIRRAHASFIRTTAPSASCRCEHRGSTDSGAPLTNNTFEPPRPTGLHSADIDLRVRENSSVTSFSHEAHRSLP